MTILYRTLLHSAKGMLLKAFRGARLHEPAPAPCPAGGDVALKIHALIDAGDLAEAERRTVPLATACPNDADLQFLLGRLALKKGDSRAAAGYFENTVALRPDQAAAYVELAKLYSSWHASDQAQACYEMALKLVPEIAELHNNLGLIHLDQGRLPEAEHCFERAL